LFRWTLLYFFVTELGFFGSRNWFTLLGLLYYWRARWPYGKGSRPVVCTWFSRCGLRPSALPSYGICRYFEVLLRDSIMVWYIYIVWYYRVAYRVWYDMIWREVNYWHPHIYPYLSHHLGKWASQESLGSWLARMPRLWRHFLLEGRRGWCEESGVCGSRLSLGWCNLSRSSPLAVGGHENECVCKYKAPLFSFKKKKKLKAHGMPCSLVLTSLVWVCQFIDTPISQIQIQIHFISDFIHYIWHQGCTHKSLQKFGSCAHPNKRLTNRN
jgi:hypothetical protein